MVKVEIPFKAVISYDSEKISFLGSVELENKLNNKKVQFGLNPMLWQTSRAQDGYDILVNEFILRCQNNYAIPYIHEELCHCRMVPTEKVVNVIKQGLWTVAEVGRVTMAGTGCGSCKKDIEEIVKYLIK